MVIVAGRATGVCRVVPAGGRAIVQPRKHAGWAGGEGHSVDHVHRWRWDHGAGDIHVSHLVLQVIQHFVGTVPALHAGHWHRSRHGAMHRHGHGAVHWARMDRRWEVHGRNG